jgi:DNA ligase-1
MRPLLCPQEDPLSKPNFFDDLQFPYWCSPKYDGIRAITFGGIVYSRTWKPLRSYQVQTDFGKHSYLDGEIIEGNSTDSDVYNRTQSHVMSFDKPGDLTYYVFDFLFDITEPYETRYARLKEYLRYNHDSSIKLVEQKFVATKDDLLAYEDSCLRQGYEGIIFRNPRAHYKQGRATWNDNIIYKLKRFQEEEGIIVDFEQRYHNTNEQTIDAQGYAERSSSKDGLVPTNMVGKFIVSYDDWLLEVAPGAFSHKDLTKIWANKESYVGKTLKFRFMLYGMKDKPRFPRAVGFRDKDDL